MPKEIKSRGSQRVNLSAVMLFAEYAERTESSRIPVSFRDFMEARGGSHRSLVQTVDQIEERSKHLLITRAIIGKDGRRTGEFIDYYPEDPTGPTRRQSGMITRYGLVWAMLGVYIRELIAYLLDGNASTEELTEFLREQRRAVMMKANTRFDSGLDKGGNKRPKL